MKSITLLYVAVPALVSLAVTTSVSAEEYVRTDRYTLATIDPRGDQTLPLTAVITITFGPDIQTVGQALEQVLEGSGYRWIVHTGENGDEVLNDLPLPAIVRNMGPIRIQDALDTIAGESWGLVIYNYDRTVWFEPVNKNHSIRTVE